MKFTDNANLTTLLLGEPIQLNILDDEGSFLQEFQLLTPSVGQLYTDQKLQMSLGLLNTPLATLHEKFPFIKDFTYYTLLTSLKLFESKSTAISRHLEYMIYSFKVFGLDLTIDLELKINNQSINEEIFEYLRNLILFLSKIKGKNDNILEQDPRYKASQDLIAKIKGQNKSNQNNDKNFEKNFIVLLWEFGLTPDEIRKLNMYQYETILSYTSSAVSTKIGTVAAGNGLTKKFKYITEGGKKNGK